MKFFWREDTLGEESHAWRGKFSIYEIEIFRDLQVYTRRIDGWVKLEVNNKNIGRLASDALSSVLNAFKKFELEESHGQNVRICDIFIHFNSQI